MPAPIPTTIEVDGNAIRQSRLTLCKTLAEVAGPAQISAGYLSMLENGKRKHIRPRVLRDLAASLDVDPAELRACKPAAVAA